MLTINLYKLTGQNAGTILELLKIESTGNVRVVIPRKIFVTEPDLQVWYNDYCRAFYLLYKFTKLSRSVSYAYPLVYSAKWFSFKLAKPKLKPLAELLAVAIKLYQQEPDEESTGYLKEAQTLWNNIINGKTSFEARYDIEFMKTLRNKMRSQQAIAKKKGSKAPQKMPDSPGQKNDLLPGATSPNKVYM